MKHALLALATALMVNGLFVPVASAADCAAGTADDVTYRGDTAINCEAQAGNDGNPLGAFGDTYDLFAKFDDGPDATPGTVYTGETIDLSPTESITFSLKYLGLDSNTGLYGYELLADADPDSLLPATLDLVVLIKQGSGYQAYLFSPATVDSSGNLGTFASLFGPGVNDFSHFSVFGTDLTPGNGGGGGNGGNVPEPGSLALIGLALAGLGAMRRRRSA